MLLWAGHVDFRDMPLVGSESGAPSLGFLQKVLGL